MISKDYIDSLVQFRSRWASRRRIDVVLKVYTVVGLLTTVFAIGYFLLTILPFQLSPSQQIALTIAGTGLALAALSSILVFLRKEREVMRIERIQEYDAISHFIGVWSEFESISREALKKDGSEVNIHSLREVISNLYDISMIDKGDIVVLVEALQVRNAIVHGGRGISPAVAKNTAESLLNVIGKMTTTKFES